MAAKSKAAKAGGAATAAYGSPYVQRLIQDAELRDNLRAAYEAGRNAYGRLNNGKAPAKALVEDKKLQKELRTAADALKDASEALREGPKRKRKGGLRRLLLLGILGGGVALGVSSGLRNKVLDLLFGAEEEFDYTSTTTPVTPASGSETPEAASGTVGT
jgi:hypothetical protein